MLISNIQSKHVDFAHTIHHAEITGWRSLRYTFFCVSSKLYIDRVLLSIDSLIDTIGGTTLSFRTHCSGCIQRVICTDHKDVVRRCIDREVFRLVEEIYNEEGLKDYLA